MVTFKEDLEDGMMTFINFTLLHLMYIVHVLELTKAH